MFWLVNVPLVAPAMTHRRNAVEASALLHLPDLAGQSVLLRVHALLVGVTPRDVCDDVFFSKN